MPQVASGGSDWLLVAKILQVWKLAKEYYANRDGADDANRNEGYKFLCVLCYKIMKTIPVRGARLKLVMEFWRAFLSREFFCWHSRFASHFSKDLSFFRVRQRRTFISIAANNSQQQLSHRPAFYYKKSFILVRVHRILNYFQSD